MKKILLGSILASVVLLSGCTDATMAKITSYGSSAHVVCYSGGVVIFDGHSTGKIKSEESSDGYYFEWKETSDLMELSGDCVFNYGH